MFHNVPFSEIAGVFESAAQKEPRNKKAGLSLVGDHLIERYRIHASMRPVRRDYD